jgi:hypothetical protein
LDRELYLAHIIKWQENYIPAEPKWHLTQSGDGKNLYLSTNR